MGGWFLRAGGKGAAMSPVVQANCPHCQNVLRIPEEWLSRSMRCMRCQKIFQAKAKP
jgi:hypothetical protein